MIKHEHQAKGQEGNESAFVRNNYLTNCYNMRKNILTTSVLLSIWSAFSAADTASTFARFNFTKGGGLGESTVSADGENNFRAVLKNTQHHNHVVCRANFEYTAAAQQKLVFRLKGNPGNGKAFVNVLLAYAKDGKWVAVESPAIDCNNAEFKQQVFALDQDFKLGDATYPLRQIKFVLNADRNPKDSVAQIEVSGVKIVNAEDIASSGTGFMVVPMVVKSVPQGGVKIFFDFDNDDQSGHRQSRVSPGIFIDPVPDAGYRQLLLEHTEGIFMPVGTPEEADVIVYSRASPGQNAERIVAAANAGKSLVIYGIPADHAIGELLPGTVIPITISGLPKRQQLRVGSPQFPLLKNMRLTDAPFAAYAKIACKPEHVMLAFQEGDPYLTAKGNVIHCNGGIGNLIDLTVTNYYDRAFLRLAALRFPAALEALDQRDQKLFTVAAQADQEIIRRVGKTAGVAETEMIEYRVGRSKNNVGRFGWQVGEPLPINTVGGKDLSVANGEALYRFHTGGTKTYNISNWTCQVVDGTVTYENNALAGKADPCGRWSGHGTVEYHCEKIMPPDWKGKRISFFVKDGIDDCDEVYFNDTLIGKTGQETPYHWMTERNYPIPEKLVRWGQPNRIVMRIINLKGEAGCGSPPVIRVSSGADRELLTVTGIDWAGKEYCIRNDNTEWMMRFSLLTPFVLYRFSEKKTFLGQENIAEFALYQTATGVKKVAVKDVFYDHSRDDAWTAPWLLLYRAKDTKPLLLVFTSQPKKLTALFGDGTLEGFEIESASPLTLSAGWPWGVRRFPDGLPARWEDTVELSLSWALNYPVACDEIFRIDQVNKLVHIIQQFHYLPLKDEWNTSLRNFVFLPPLTGFMSTRKDYVKTTEPLTDFGIDTGLGPTLGKIDASTVSFTLPLPEIAPDILPVGVKHESLNAFQNKNFAGGVRFSCGGGIKTSEWTPANPNGTGIPLNNIDLFAWNFGLCMALQGAFFLTPENRLELDKRILARYIEPLDRYQYKNAFIHRREPFSGLRYPILFNSFYPLGVDYMPGTGSQVVYGDSNEACTVAIWLGQLLADAFGQSGLVRTNWSFLRYVMRYQEAIDDYSFSAGSCRETGVGASIDMLNCEYPNLIAYARLAQLNDDDEARKQALYRAAVKGIPTLARLTFADYYVRLYPEFEGKKHFQITGFDETGAKLMIFPNNSHNFHAANDLFNFSQGVPASLYYLYRQYGLAQIEEHLRERALPQLTRAKAIRGEYLLVMGLFGVDLPLFAEGEKNARIFYLGNDWGGMRVAAEFGFPLWRSYGRIGLEEFADVNLQKMFYTPEDGLLTMNFQAGENAVLVLASDLMPLCLSVNGKAEMWTPLHGNRLSLPIVPGPNKVEMSFQQERNSER